MNDKYNKKKIKEALEVVKRIDPIDLEWLATIAVVAKIHPEAEEALATLATMKAKGIGGKLALAFLAKARKIIKTK